MCNFLSRLILLRVFWIQIDSWRTSSQIKADRMQLSSMISLSREGPVMLGGVYPRTRSGSCCCKYRHRPRFSVTKKCLSAPDPSLSTHLEKQNGVQEDLKMTPNFQEAISRLQQYWSSVGCLVWLPHNTEVGAGTMNPATFLRVLGPEPWNVCYAEPSIRPDDSRFGENPNRIQRHTQFQVILKPDPGNPQELFLQSLEALGIDCEAHDVRFVEDNWESPVLGAWGLGWEVWLDGMEITQFTYFQQTGSLMLPIPSIEITYGLERILMSLQNVDHFKKIQYNDTLTYGELFMQTEVEMSRYNMEEALIEDQWRRFELFKKEAGEMLEKKLALPAYDNLLKCSHTFNILDARGAVGVTERNTCFGDMRRLARQAAKLWLEEREKMDFPLAKQLPSSFHDSKVNIEMKLSALEPRLFVLEIGCEEIPPHEVSPAALQLRERFLELLQETRLPYKEVEVYSTPRRLTVLVHELVGSQKSLDLKIKGPPVSIAYDQDQQPTKALLGFCKKSEISLDAVVQEVGPKGVEFVYGLKKEEGKNTAKTLCEKLPEILKKISFQKSMKWNGNDKWSRPIRWLLALHGDILIPFQFANLTACTTTRVLRSSTAEVMSLTSAEKYLDVIKEAGITLDMKMRSEKIWTAAQDLAGGIGGFIPEKFRRSLLEEVVNLVEAPVPVVGNYSEEFLLLPRPVLETVMTKYQRYFPVYSNTDSSQMMPRFIGIGNGSFDLKVVQQGYESVLRARFKDAQFFYQEDLKSSLEAFVPLLSGTLFHKSLGSLLDKTRRTTSLIHSFGKLMDLTEQTISIAKRASEICRADLATSLVTEMTSLSGIMGQHYALKSGESSEVAQAVFESVLPRFSGDLLPSSLPGLLVSVTDKVETLIGMIAAGCAPSATADPYGLRRLAYGLVQALIKNKTQIDLQKVISIAAELQPLAVNEDIKNETFEFIQRRLEQYLMDKEIPPSIVRSVLSERSSNPYLAEKGTTELVAEWEKGVKSELPRVKEALGRVSRIIKGKSVNGHVNETLLQEEAEIELWKAYQQTKTQIRPSIEISEFLNVCEKMIVSKIEVFFEEVFVMCEDEELRQNRFRLLKSVSTLSSGILNFAELTGI